MTILRIFQFLRFFVLILPKMAGNSNFEKIFEYKNNQMVPKVLVQVKKIVFSKKQNKIYIFIIMVMSTLINIPKRTYPM